MKINQKSTVVILNEKDLTKEGKEKVQSMIAEYPQTHWFSPSLNNTIQKADVVIYETPGKVRRIISFNEDLVA